MAARRNKTQAKRNSGNGTPGWVWLVAGLVIGAAVFFTVPGLMKPEGDGFFRPQPNPDARPAPVADGDSAVESAAPEQRPAEAAAPAAPKETQYDFYTLLPGKEVEMSDAELAASARAEAERNARAQRQQDAAADGAQPKPLPEEAVAAADPNAASTSPRPIPPPSTSPPSASSPS
ncbi:MAG TPA: sporulation protein, partial [Pseudoxanthomonas sp.]|nr:sporulation protein [Pseudoxanthomonas sp.]